ncbi:MAG TPA: energy transducer TonB [Gemmatimonadaceae bacterium]|nr:energy transducer TonB [Gemmatimonadaceae bacterium]
MRAIARAGYIGIMPLPFRRRFLSLLLATASAAACTDHETSQKVAQAFQTGSTAPDEVPRMLNSDLPFRYPAALYARKIQGNVTLRLRIDRDGQVAADSTRIEESSGYAALDSAAVKGSQELHFIPAKLRGEPMPVTILFPVYFRHPDAHALPGDTILKRGATTSQDKP